MAETAEGIGSRKWSYQRTSDGILILMEGTKPIAALTEEGAKVFQLLVTAPQLWEEANQLVKGSVALGNLGGISAECRLANLVAKAAGRSSWKEVDQ